MSDPEPTPAERLRRIEEETDQLDRHIDEAREAVRHAARADTMAMPGDESGEGSAGSVGGRADEEYPNDEDERGEGDEHDARKGQHGQDRQDEGGTDRTE